MVLSCTVSEILAKNCLFFLPLSHSAPSLPMFPLELAVKSSVLETRVMGLSYSEDPMIVAGVVLTQCQRVTDGQTDGRTDGFTIANTALWRAVKKGRCPGSTCPVTCGSPVATDRLPPIPSTHTQTRFIREPQNCPKFWNFSKCTVSTWKWCQWLQDKRPLIHHCHSSLSTTRLSHINLYSNHMCSSKSRSQQIEEREGNVLCSVL